MPEQTVPRGGFTSLYFNKTSHSVESYYSEFFQFDSRRLFLTGNQRTEYLYETNKTKTRRFYLDDKSGS